MLAQDYFQYFTFVLFTFYVELDDIAVLSCIISHNMLVCWYYNVFPVSFLKSNFKNCSSGMFQHFHVEINISFNSIK